MSLEMGPVLHLMLLVRECRREPGYMPPRKIACHDCRRVTFRRKVGNRKISTVFALSLADVRLVQTARLLRTLLDDDQLDTAAVKRALRALEEAQREIKELRAVFARDGRALG